MTDHTKRDLETRLDRLADEVGASKDGEDPPEEWMRDVPRELWDDPGEMYMWCLENDSEHTPDAYFRMLVDWNSDERD